MSYLEWVAVGAAVASLFGSLFALYVCRESSHLDWNAHYDAIVANQRRIDATHRSLAALEAAHREPPVNAAPLIPPASGSVPVFLSMEVNGTVTRADYDLAVAILSGDHAAACAAADKVRDA